MATRVNSTGATPIRGSGVDTSSTVLGWTPTSGNVLILSLASWHSGTTIDTAGGVTDSYSNTWAVAVEAATNANARAHIAYCEVTSTGASFSVQIDPTNSGLYLEWCVEEWADLDTASLLRTTGATTGNNAAASVATDLSTPASGDVAIAVLSLNGDSDVGLTTASGFTRTAYNANAGATIGMESAYQSLSGSGAVTATWGHDSSTWSAAIAVFKGVTPPEPAFEFPRTFQPSRPLLLR